MNWIQLTLAVAWNEMQVLFKDKGALAILLLLPLLIAGLINAPQLAGWANEEEPQISFNLAVVNEDEGLYGEQIVDALKSIDVLNVTEMTDAATADTQVADREVEAAVLIPNSFSRQVDTYTGQRGGGGEPGGRDSLRHSLCDDGVGAVCCG